MKKFLGFIALITLSISGISFIQAWKQITMAKVVFSIPNDWKELDVARIDSRGISLSTNNGSIINIEYGMYNEPIEKVVPVYSLRKKRELDSLGFDTIGMSISKTPSIDQNQGTFHKEYFYYETINDLHCKIQIPKKPGYGNIKLYVEFNNKERFSIYAVDLPKVDQEQLVEVFNTVKLAE